MKYGSVNRTCPTCGRVYHVPGWKVKDGRGTHCSRECHNARRSELAAKDNPRHSHSAGYVMVKRPDHPRAYRGFVFEHVVVAEQVLGRLLEDDEVVHHINGIKDDNRPKNLEVISRSDHTRSHLRAHGFITNQYGTWPIRAPKKT